jgi:cytochrome c oxidase subunit III
MSPQLVEEGRLSLPMGSIGTSASGWWGAWFIIISDASIFGYLFFAYFWYSVQPPANWVPGGPPSFIYAAPQTALVLLGCGSAWFAHRSINRNQIVPALVGLALTIVLGAGFIALQALDWASKPFGLSSSTYGSIYFVITGTHLAHFVVGWIMFLILLLWTLMGYFDRIRHVPIIVGALYWYFLAATWLSVFFVINCTPYFF